MPKSPSSSGTIWSVLVHDWRWRCWFIPANAAAMLSAWGRSTSVTAHLYVKQEKTGAELVIPIHPELAAVIAATPSGHLTFLTTRFGRPFEGSGFSHWFRGACDQAGLPHCSPHGLRKAAARRLAEAGCTAHEIGAITGHASLAELVRYTRAADQRRLAEAAMAKTRKSSGKPGQKFANRARNVLKIKARK